MTEVTSLQGVPLRRYSDPVRFSFSLLIGHQTESRPPLPHTLFVLLPVSSFVGQLVYHTLLPQCIVYHRPQNNTTVLME